jgi:hypothetical protein
MTLFGRVRSKKTVEDPVFRNNGAANGIQQYPPDFTGEQMSKVAPVESNVSEETVPENKAKVTKFQVVCLPLDMSSGRVLLVTKTDDKGVWVLVSIWC